MGKKYKNVFISHYGEDDQYVQNLKAMLKKRDYELRNSSIDSTKTNYAQDEHYIKYDLLRPGINWAGTLIVLIGDKTHSRPWVDWEIEQANKLGTRIIGVYAYGSNGATLPANFELYGNALVGWNPDRIIDALNGKLNNWEALDGTSRVGTWSSPRSNC